eukprot:3561616-Prymnesium_polylepis.1
MRLLLVSHRRVRGYVSACPLMGHRPSCVQLYRWCDRMLCTKFTARVASEPVGTKRAPQRGKVGDTASTLPT